MSNTEYDAHFAGFAKALWRELEANIKFIPEGQTMRKAFLPVVERIIAQRAYDLVVHACQDIYEIAGVDNVVEVLTMLEEISDLPVFPKEQE